MLKKLFSKRELKKYICAIFFVCVCVCNLFLFFTFKNVYTLISIEFLFIISLQDFLPSETKVEIYYKRLDEVFIKMEFCFKDRKHCDDIPNNNTYVF